MPPVGGSGRGSAPAAASGPASTSGRGPDSAQKWPQEGCYDMQKRCAMVLGAYRGGMSIGLTVQESYIYYSLFVFSDLTFG